MIPCNRCRRKRPEIAARIGAKRPRRRAERAETSLRSPRSPSSTPSRAFSSPPRDAWPSSRGVGNAQGARRGRQGTRSTAQNAVQNGAVQGRRAWGRYPPRRWRRVEVSARGAKRKSARCRRQAWRGSTSTLGEPSAASGRCPRPGQSRRTPPGWRGTLAHGDRT